MKTKTSRPNLFVAFLIMIVMVTANISLAPNQARMQTVACPAGYTCTPITPSATLCPAGYTCTPVNVPATSTVPMPSVVSSPTVSPISAYSNVSLARYATDPNAYVGQDISVTGAFDMFIPSMGITGNSNFIIIDDPSNLSKPQVAIEIDDNTAYDTAVADIQSQTFQNTYGFVQAEGVAESSNTFTETNGLDVQSVVTVPVIKGALINQCANSSGLGCTIGTTVPAVQPNNTYSAPTTGPSGNIIYTPIAFESFLADPFQANQSNLDKYISIEGMVSKFIPSNGDESHNYVILTDPYDLTNPKIAVEIDSDAQYSDIVTAFQNRSDPVYSYAEANGIATTSHLFTETNSFGLQQSITLPIIDASQFEQCGRGTINTTVLGGTSLESNFSCSDWVLRSY